LPIQAAAVRARCERSAVERCRVPFDEKSEPGSTMRVWSVGVGWCLASCWLCKPEVTGSIPVRSTPKHAAPTRFLVFIPATLTPLRRQRTCGPCVQTRQDRGVTVTRKVAIASIDHRGGAPEQPTELEDRNATGQRLGRKTVSQVVRAAHANPALSRAGRQSLGARTLLRGAVAGQGAVAYLKNRPVVQGFWLSVKLGAPATA
jgi:hypothetical protein